MIRQNIYETNISEEDIAYILTTNKNENYPNCIIFADNFGINKLRKKNNIIVIDTENIVETEKNNIEDILRKIEYQIENPVFSIECREQVNVDKKKSFILKVEKTFLLMKKNNCKILFAYIIFPVNSEKYHIYYIVEKAKEYPLEKMRALIDEINDILNNNYIKAIYKENKES